MQTRDWIDEAVEIAMQDWAANTKKGDTLELGEMIKRELHREAKRISFAEFAHDLNPSDVVDRVAKGGSLAAIYADHSLSVQVAERASKDPRVDDFRARHLQMIGSFHEPDIDALILKLLEQDSLLEGAELTPDRLPYITQSMRDFSRPWVQIYDRGVLRELYDLGLDLTRQYIFSLPQAINFLLWITSGDIPLILGTSIFFRADHEIPELSRIVISVHPRTSSREVTELYQRWRSRLDIPEKRKLKDKTVELARFVDRERRDYEAELREGPWVDENPELTRFFASIHSRKPPKQPWRVLFVHWNISYPKWTYSSHRNFIRDAIKAQKSLQEYYWLSDEEIKSAEQVLG